MRTFAREPPKALRSGGPTVGRGHQERPLLDAHRAIADEVVQRWPQSRAESPPAGESPGSLHDFSRISVHAPSPAEKRSFGCSQPMSVGSSDTPQEPLGEFNEEGQEGLEGPPAAPLGEMEPAPAVPEAATQTAATATTTVIRGPREMWNFNGQSPAGYAVAEQLSTNRSGGVFAWSTSPHLTLSSATDPRPTVTTALPTAAARDAWIRVRHTSAGGASSAASYRLTILAPDSLTHINDVDSATAGLGYTSEIHYSIHDQFGTVLPRDLPLNEQFTGPAVQDFPGGNWTRPPQCGATGVCGASFNPADFFDRVTGEGDVGAIPAPVGPTDPGAAVAAEHWPGDWFIGGQVPGTGRRVRTVTWQRNRGFARHT